MSQKARARRAADAAKQQQAHRRATWVASALVGVVLGALTLFLLSRAQSGAPAPPPAKHRVAADQNASPALIKAAVAIGFHTSTEPGVGLVESQPAGSVSADSNPSLLKPGTVAPAFTLRTPQGTTVSLSDFRGKAVLLELFATWCPHCQAEAPHLARLAQQLQSRGVYFVAINADSENAASVFAYHRYFALPFPALLDQGTPTGSFTQQGASGPVTTAYKLAAYPTFYVITPSGKVAWAADGEQPDALLAQKLLAVAPPSQSGA